MGSSRGFGPSEEKEEDLGKRKKRRKQKKGKEKKFNPKGLENLDTTSPSKIHESHEKDYRTFH